MNNHQYKNVFLRSEVTTALREATTFVRSFKAGDQSAKPEALRCLNRALAFARQLSDTQSNMATRAHIVSALSWLEHGHG